MAVKLNNYIYPYIDQVKDFPVYLTGIGGTEYHGHADRPEGYLWHQILYCASGTGVLKFDDVTIPITENSCFFLPADYPHEYYPECDKWNMRWVVFDGYACRSLLDKLNLTRPVLIKPDDSTTLLKLFDRMFVTLKTDKVYGNYKCAGLVYEYLMEFHCLAADKSMMGGADKSDILMPALNYIEDNFRHDFPISILAQCAGVSQQYLCKIFNQTMNTRPNEYITKRRLQEAMRLLLDTSDTLSEISDNVGFSNVGYFCSVFKKHIGVTPTVYRKMHNTNL